MYNPDDNYCLIYNLLFRRATPKEIAHNNRRNAALFMQHCSNHWTVKMAIRRWVFLKLPRLDRRPNVKSQTPSSCQETEQKNESYKCCVAIDKNFPPLQAVTKQGTCSLERWKGSKDVKRRDETYVHFGVHRILDQYATKVIRLRTRLLKINSRLPRCSDDLCSYFADG